MIWNLIQRKDWMVTINLKDTYLSVPVAQERRQFLRFAWRDNLFEAIKALIADIWPANNFATLAMAVAMMSGKIERSSRL